MPSPEAQSDPKTETAIAVNAADFYYRLLAARYNALSSSEKNHIDATAIAQGWPEGYLSMLGMIKEVLHFIHENSLFFPVKDLASWLESVRALQRGAASEAQAVTDADVEDTLLQIDLLLLGIMGADNSQIQNLQAILILSDDELQAYQSDLPPALLETLQLLKKEQELEASRALMRRLLEQLKQYPQLFQQIFATAPEIKATATNNRMPSNGSSSPQPNR